MLLYGNKEKWRGFNECSTCDDACQHLCLWTENVTADCCLTTIMLNLSMGSKQLKMYYTTWGLFTKLKYTKPSKYKNTELGFHCFPATHRLLLLLLIVIIIFTISLKLTIHTLIIIITEQLSSAQTESDLTAKTPCEPQEVYSE